MFPFPSYALRTLILLATQGDSIPTGVSSFPFSTGSVGGSPVRQPLMERLKPSQFIP